MSFKKHILDVTENFFLSTHVPIQTFQPDGTPIHSVGYNDVFRWVFDNQDIYERLNHKILNAPHSKVVTISCLTNIYFTACPVCPRSRHKGIFILGPYSSFKENKIKATYKPKSLMPHLLSFLDTLCSDCPNKPLPTSGHKPYSLHVKKAIDYICARYMNPITLSNVSDYLNISKPYFCLLFKEETNQTFTQFLNNLRVEKSKELLQESDFSMLDIALRVGFNNQNYYNIIFKRLTNQTPLEFRKSA